MLKRVWTYELAMAASKDAANSSMRKAGRARWNEDDWNIACETMDRLFPSPNLSPKPSQALEPNRAT